MKPIRTLFATYSSVGDDPLKPSFIGVLKRCVRLIAGMPSGVIEPHIVNFGGVPTDDPLLNKILPQLTLYEQPPGSGYSQFSDFFDSIKPDVIVLGEGPGRGIMRNLSRAANIYGIPQICVENYYSFKQPAHFKQENPGLNQWLLIGLALDNHYGRITENAILVPPLLPKVESPIEDYMGFTILGYDINAAEYGLDLLCKLPTNIKARLLYSKTAEKQISDLAELVHDHDVSCMRLPTEIDLCQILASSRFVVCKNGFQQIVECLALGTPVVTFEAPGGVPEIYLNSTLRKYVRYFPKNSLDWSHILLEIAIWLARRPVTPWSDEIQKMKNAVKFASERLLELIELVHQSKIHSRR